MTRALTILNAVGVVALAVLCVVQWQRDRQLNYEVAALLSTNHVQAAALVEQSNALRGVTADLSDFKQRFGQAHKELSEALTAQQKLERENNQLVLERDQLKASVTNWAEAVAQRDQRLKEATAQAKELVAKLNDSIVRFNELATNYNASVRRFNDLATNYNNVVGELNDLRSKEQKQAQAAAAK